MIGANSFQGNSGQRFALIGDRIEPDLIASILLVPEILEHLKIETSDFADPAVGRLFGAIQSGYRETGKILFGRCMAAFRAGSGIEPESNDDCCREEIIELIETWVAWWHWRFYAQNIRQASQRRRIVAAAQQLIANATDPMFPVEELRFDIQAAGGESWAV